VHRTHPAPLTGGSAIWIIMIVEAITFGLFFFYFADGWGRDTAAFSASQAQLHPNSATFGTMLLLTGSWTAYIGVLRSEAQQGKVAARWFVATAVLGTLFCANKLVEYSHLSGVNLSTNGFWFAYLFLTGLHLLHVLGGVVGFGGLAWLASQERTSDEEDLLWFQAGAVYWHIVDVIWLMLFPIIYLMHP
jgi:nitric oxide reductase NorE protein